MSVDHANGGGKPPDIDPAAVMKTQMAMAVRQIEAQFPGCHVTLFVADTAAPANFSYATSAPNLAVRATLGAFLKEAQ